MLTLNADPSRTATYAAGNVVEMPITPEQRFARAIERSGHGRNWPYLFISPSDLSVRMVRGAIERHGFPRERITTECTTEGDALHFTTLGARTYHKIVRIDVASLDANDIVAHRAVAASEMKTGAIARTVVRINPTDRGAETVHRIIATLAREHDGVVVKWTGRNAGIDTFEVLAP